MPKFNDLVIPLIISFILLYGAIKQINVFEVFIEGAKDGISIAFKILPALVALITAVGMFKASGALDVLTHALAPMSNAIQVPGELVPLAILRPVSGSGSLAIFENTLNTYGPDSFLGRVASVMQGSTETTFYTIAVYYGAINVQKTRHTVFCALIADFVGFIMSTLAVRLLF